MKCNVIRDDKLNVTGVQLEMPIMTEHGWATAVVDEPVERYSTRGTSTSAVRVRLAHVDTCPNDLNELKQQFPNYLSHQMWDNSQGIKVLD